MNNNTIWHKRIPTLFGIIVGILGLVLMIFLLRNNVSFLGKTDESIIPENIQVSNLSDTSFTLSYTTKTKALGSLSYGPTKTLGETVFDDRDKSAKTKSAYTTHHLTATNLKPNTTYFFNIISSDTIFLNNNALFQIKTAAALQESFKNTQTIQGTILLPNGQKAQDALVFVTVDNSQQLSVPVNTDGTYSISLASLRTAPLSQNKQVDNNSKVEIHALNEKDQSKALITAEKARQTPPITLSRNYTFLDIESSPSEQAQVVITPTNEPVQNPTTPPLPTPTTKPSPTAATSLVGGTNPTVVPTRTPTPTIIPTVKPSPTTTPLPSPTIKPSPTKAQPTPIAIAQTIDGTLPAPGDELFGILFGITSLLATFSGILLLRYSKRNQGL